MQKGSLSKAVRGKAQTQLAKSMRQQANSTPLVKPPIEVDDDLAMVTQCLTKPRVRCSVLTLSHFILLRAYDPSSVPCAERRERCFTACNATKMSASSHSE